MPPRLAKLLAILVAAALVAGAFYYRSRKDDGGGKTDGSTPTTPDRSGPLKITCVTELEAVCRALEGPDSDLEVEPAGKTAKTLVGAEVGKAPIDAWITLAPWPAMVDVDRKSLNRDPLFASEGTTVASSPLVVLGQDPATAECRNLDWPCLGAKAKALKLGVPAADSALGVLVAAQAAAAFLGRVDFASNDFSDGFRRRLADLVESAERLSSPEQANRLLFLGPGKYGAVGTADAIARTFSDTTQGRAKRLTVSSSQPPMRADVVVAMLANGDRADRVLELFSSKTGQTILQGAGWTPGKPKGSNNLPDPDVLVALRQEIG